MSHHYDVVCVGISPGTLVAAALLARRTFRVLVVGEGHVPRRYAHDGISLLRSQPVPVGLDTPVFARVLTELAEEQTWRRRTAPLDPMFQLRCANARLAVPPSLERFLREVERELPQERASVQAFYPELAEYNVQLDALFRNPSTVFASGLFARRRRERALQGLDALLAGMPEAPGGPLARGLDAAIEFATHVVDPHPLARLRLHGSWTRGLHRAQGGYDALLELLLQRLAALGARIELGSRLEEATVRGQRVHSVRLDDARTPIHCGWLITSAQLQSTLAKIGDFSLSERELAGYRAPRAVARRMSVCFAAPAAAFPEAMAEETFVIDERGALRLHLARDLDEGRSVLVAETALEQPAIPEAREHVVQRVFEQVPFLDENIELVDSVHDARPLWDYRSGARRNVARIELGAAQGGEPAQPLYAVEGGRGLEGERWGKLLPNALPVGPTVLPSFGLEGEILAAVHAAEIVTESDRTRARMRRELWSKLELSG